MLWKNSWFQLTALVAVMSGGLLIYDFGPGIYLSLMTAKSVPSSPAPAPSTPPNPTPAPVTPPASPPPVTDDSANARGGLMVKTDPEGATVALGGEDVQTSPATFKGVKLGSYPIHITLDGYEPVDQTTEIKGNQFTDLGTISLVHSKGSLQITSTPSDANYTLRNDALGINQSGKCPDLIKDIPVGTYEVTVTRGNWSLPGTATLKRNDTVVSNSTFTYGTATVTSEPSGAVVSQSGRNLGTTPLNLQGLRPGSYAFDLALPGYQPASVSGNVSANAAATIPATLEKTVGPAQAAARVASDDDEAAAYRVKAMGGDVEAARMLGLLYSRGQGVPKDYAEALKWYQKAADQGNAFSQNEIGWMYQNGLGVTKDYSQALNWYQKAADQSLATAQDNIGIMYLKGQGVAKDYSQAFNWFQKAATLGNAEAQNDIGYMYQDGLGVTIDYDQAFNWYQKAANQGNDDAQNDIGIMYVKGQGVARDYSQALIWFHKAAAQGNASAQNDIGAMYENGWGVAENLPTAVKWYKRAASQDNTDAQDALKRLGY